MKKIIILLAAILSISLIGMSAISANAAEITRYSTAHNQPVDNDSNKSAKESVGAETENDDLPSRYSSAELGYTTSVKTQTGGNLCWAYSSMSSFESLLLKNSLFYDDLSVSAIDDWGCADESGNGWQRSQGDAGYTLIPVGFFTSWNGPLSKTETSPRYGVTALSFFEKYERDEIKRAIMRSGAVTTNFNNNALGKSTDRNAFFITDAIGVISGHSVSVVGWDDNYSKDNFTGNYHPENDGAWLCKNSWGEDFNSIGGYLWISYEDYFHMNSDYFDNTFCVESFQEIKENDHIYQNEIYGATYEFQYVNSTKQTYFNVFDFSENGNVLDKIIFETPSKGADYKVYYVPLTDTGTPVKDRAAWTTLSEGKVGYHGYICADIDDLTIPKAKAAIAVELDNSKNCARCGIGVSEWLRDPKTNFTFFSDQGTKGESFIEYENEIIDLMDYYHTYNQDDVGGTFVIKAITNNTASTNLKGDVNLNGQLDINDATLIQLYLVGLNESLYADQLTNSDYNGDGIININDTTQIQIDLAKG